MYNEKLVDDLIESTGEIEKQARAEINKIMNALQGTTISIQVNEKDVTKEVMDAVNKLDKNAEKAIISTSDEFKDAIIAETGCTIKEFYKAIKEFSMRKDISASTTEGTVAMLPLVYKYCIDNPDSKADLIEIINSKR